MRHISQIEGDSAGYDILSFTPDGHEKYVEVKNMRGGIQSPFFISSKEVAFSEQHSDSYVLYRVYDYDQEQNIGKFYAVGGDITKGELRLDPIQYRVSLER